MPNRNVFNDVAENLKIQIYGDEVGVLLNVDEQGNVVITGSLGISVTTPLNITGTVGFSDEAVVGITGQPTVIMGGRKFTEIVQTTSINLTSTGVTSIYTDGIDVLEYSKYSYYVSPSITNISSITVQSQIATTNLSGSFINSPLSPVTISNNNAKLANVETCMQYSRLELLMNPSVIPATGIISIIFQGNS